MSTQISCYSALSLDISRECLELAIGRLSAEAKGRIFITAVAEVYELAKVMLSDDYRFNAICGFAIRFVEIGASEFLSELSTIIKSVFGESNIIMLYDGEELI